METRHSPTPWRAVKVPGGWNVKDAGNNVPCVARIYHECDLSMILAAPAMYEACKAMYLACATDKVRRVLGSDYDHAFGLARGALAQVDGKQA